MERFHGVLGGEFWGEEMRGFVFLYAGVEFFFKILNGGGKESRN